MKTATTIREKGIFVLNYSARPKKNILVTFNVKSISGNKKFWKTIKPFFSNKGLNTNNMMLVEDNEIIREEEIIANMNNYFTNITTHLKLKPTKIDPKANLRSIMNTLQNHESVQRIRLANFHSKSSLKFNSVSGIDVKKEILNLPSKKATRKGDIPAKTLKNSINAYLSELKILITNCLKKRVFPTTSNLRI